MRVVHLLRNSVFIRLLATVGAMLTVAIFAPWNGVSGAGLRWLDTGGWPVQAVTMDASERLYATGVGGASGGGVVFQLTPDATKTRWTAKVLYNFPRCSSKWQISYDPKYDPQGFARGRGVAVRSPTRCADGDGPRPELVMDSSRRIYGTTLGGGAAESGVIFELTPDVTRTKWTEKVLHSFDRPVTGASKASVMLGASGQLYATESGALSAMRVGYPPNGAAGMGRVIELSPNATKTTWTEKILYNFCSRPSCADGATPLAALIADASGSLYGTTLDGGAHGGGTVFQLTPDPSKTKWTHTVLHSFCPSQNLLANVPNCPDGSGPAAPLVMSAGKLYGTTQGGGAAGKGTVFELIPNAATGTWTKNLLYSFCAQAGCRDGSGPDVFIVMDAAGDLHGTTGYGGTAGGGTVFKLTHNQATDTWSEAVLYSFCYRSQCGGTYQIGINPLEPPIMDPSGNVYGGTRNGGGGSPNSRDVWMLETQSQTRRSISPRAPAARGSGS